MTWNQIRSAIRKRFGDKILGWREHNERRIYVDIDPDDLVEFGRFLFHEQGARFIIASALDTPRGGVEILYHFDFYQLPQVLSLRVFAKKPDPEVDSIAGVIKGSEWIEREISELLGVRVRNHPNPEHLLLPRDWPKGNYPLRRDA
jgi:NADH-quinone oxidoreductase subunit C